MFKDRIDAGMQLVEKLLPLKNEDVVVLAVPRGGLPLGAIIAKTLDAPLNIVLSKKIGHPSNREYAIGAVSMDYSVLGDVTGVSEDYIKEETARLRQKMKARYLQYYKNIVPTTLTGKTVVIVDDGIATGNTMLVTVALVSHQKPKKIIVAIPIAPTSAIRKLNALPELEEVVCLRTPVIFKAVGQFYENFYQLSDAEAIRILEESN